MTGFSKETFFGGSSSVAPQLNGTVGLVGQSVHGRLGLLNVPLYQMAASSAGYDGKDAPLNVNRYGNKDFHTGRDGYSPAAGVGTLDVADFADAIKKACGLSRRLPAGRGASGIANEQMGGVGRPLVLNGDGD